ncbi:hypothetical protein EJ357_22640 [Streptomyces cyaneochromogenes]|uniref:Uncharacterized protein n=1 Tax=Streptomyces cyaneochromogenes TaxID=2496836 RepID=A0A3S9M9U1_9ACTN|nr:DUF6415 family natural product biosynthesis protein [Streptomyces cyaneochromogenes]AZQ35931.1 hypothetical protein EJ357_22640 [Streptomyces cyaneochromogenes]
MTAPSGELARTAGTDVHPPDIETMRATAARALGPDDGPDALPPGSEEIEILDSTLRGQLALILPEVERAVGPRPKDVQAYCALACVGEARRKLTVTPRPVLDARVAHARRLARSLAALCDHYERINAGTASH